MTEKDGSEQRERILVVDDNLQTSSFVVQALEDEGYQVDRATNGMEALARCAAAAPDAILLDLLLPAMDGWQFVDALRAQMADPPPVIVMTANRMAWSHAADAQAAAYLPKPFDLDDLLGTLRRVLSGKAAGAAVPAEPSEVSTGDGART